MNKAKRSPLFGSEAVTNYEQSGLAKKVRNPFKYFKQVNHES